MPAMLSLYRHRWSIALAGAAAADSLTMVLLPHGAELNPLAATIPGLAVLLKFLAVVAILALPLGQYATNVKVTGALLWGFGFVSNLLVLGGTS